MMFATSKDVVFVEGLRVNTVIGMYDWERTIEQPVVIDLALFADTQVVAESGDLKDGINYKAVSDDVRDWTRALQAELVEELAEHLANKLLTKYQIHKITIKIGKPIAVTDANMVGVQITREK